MSNDKLRLRNKPTPRPTRSPARTPPSRPNMPTSSFVPHLYPLLISLSILLFPVLSLSIYRNYRRHSPLPILPPSTSPTDESLIRSSILPPHDPPPSSPSPLLTCIPTVARPGNIEYISNTIKSFRLATNQSLSMGHLIVFLMDSKPAHWLSRVSQTPPPWLSLLPRQGTPLPHRKLTLNDPEDRVKWRAKEAQDYAQVLRRCAAHTNSPFILVVQDDVLFTPHIHRVLPWTQQNLVPYPTTVPHRSRQFRVCGVSLFELPGAFSKIDRHIQDASNLVARVWRVEDVPHLADWLEQRYDEAPVDWLADRFCKKRKSVVLVMAPNPVRHRGLVSSFAGNKRNASLT